MLHVLQRYEWFKEVLKRMSTFEQGMCADLWYKHNDTIMFRLNRNYEEKMVLTAHYISADKFYPIFKSAIFYSVDKRCANISSYHGGHYNLAYSVQYNNKIMIKDELYDDDLNDISTRATLDYPLWEEQVFQELTRIDIPEEEYINRFVQISEEIGQYFSEKSAFTFRPYEDEINETNYEIVVQSVMECMDGLMEMEKQRIAENSQKSEA